MRTITLALLTVTAFWLNSCGKDDNTPAPVLSVDKTEVAIHGETNAIDSFVISANTPWKITISPITYWLQVDITKGDGNAVIHVKNAMENNTMQTQQVALTLSAVDKSLPAITITITQKPYFSALFNKLYGGTNSDGISSIAPTPDGGFIMAGSTYSNDGDMAGNHGNEDGFVIKVNAGGDIQWKKMLGGSAGDEISKIITTPDGGYLIAGHSYSQDGDLQGTNHNSSGSDVWVTKLDNAGNIQWGKSLGGAYEENAQDIVNTPDGGYLLAANAYKKDRDVTADSHGGTDAWIVKINNLGTIVWNKMIGGSSFEDVWAITPGKDGSFVIAGQTYSNDGDLSSNAGVTDGMLIKIDNNGTVLWAKTYGGALQDQFRNVISTPDGGFIAVGSSNSSDGLISGNHGDYDVWVVKVNNAGEVQWNKVAGGSGEDHAFSIVITPDNNYLVGGGTRSNDADATGNSGQGDALLLKLNSKGEKIWSKTLGSAKDDYCHVLLNIQPKQYILAGSSANKSSEAWLLKFE